MADTDKTAPGNATMVIDLGKKKRKQIKKLRKGKGPLSNKIDGLLAQLKEAGNLDANANTVIIVVEKKKRAMPKFW